MNQTIMSRKAGSLPAGGHGAFGGKKTILIVLPLLAISLLLAGCGKKTTLSGVKTDGESFSGSIADLIKLGKNSRCDLIGKESDQITSGTNYVASGKVRSDYVVNMQGQIYNAHSIVDSEWMYSWYDEMPNQASKIKIADMQNYQGESEANSEGAKNYEENYDYKCYSWKVDQSKFAVPADINFTDMTQLIQQMNDTSAVSNTNAINRNCSVCDMVADESAKESCKKSLNCQ